MDTGSADVTSAGLWASKGAAVDADWLTIGGTTAVAALVAGVGFFLFFFDVLSVVDPAPPF